jgi:hypothetical protein
MRDTLMSEVIRLQRRQAEWTSGLSRAAGCYFTYLPSLLRQEFRSINLARLLQVCTFMRIPPKHLTSGLGDHLYPFSIDIPVFVTSN